MRATRAPLLPLLLLLTAMALRAELTFEGYMANAEGTRFVLSVEKQRTSGWLSLGQSFGGYVLRNFDPATESLTVERDGKLQRLRLVDGRVRSTSDDESAPAARPIWVMIGQQERISLSNDPAMLKALEERLATVTAMSPQPIVSVRVRSATAPFSLVSAVLEVLKTAGIKKYSISIDPPANNDSGSVPVSTKS